VSLTLLIIDDDDHLAKPVGADAILALLAA